MPGQVTVSDDLEVHIGRSSAALTPAAAFELAERLLRGATKVIVKDAADGALVRGVLSAPGRYLRGVGE